MKFYMSGEIPMWYEFNGTTWKREEIDQLRALAQTMAVGAAKTLPLVGDYFRVDGSKIQACALGCVFLEITELNDEKLIGLTQELIPKRNDQIIGPIREAFGIIYKPLFVQEAKHYVTTVNVIDIIIDMNDAGASREDIAKWLRETALEIERTQKICD